MGNEKTPQRVFVGIEESTYPITNSTLYSYCTLIQETNTEKKYGGLRGIAKDIADMFGDTFNQQVTLEAPRGIRTCSDPDGRVYHATYHPLSVLEANTLRTEIKTIISERKFDRTSHLTGAQK